MQIKTSNSGWGSFMVSGLIAIVYGLLALLLPDDLIQTVMLVSGIGLMAVGIIGIFIALRRKKMDLPWGMLLFEAIVMVILGVVAVVWSKETVKLLVFVLGLWSAVIGVMMLFSIMRFRFLVNRGFYLVSAILSILFGVILVLNPFESAEVFVTITGIMALAFGIIMMMFGFRLKKADEGIKVELVE